MCATTLLMILDYYVMRRWEEGLLELYINVNALYFIFVKKNYQICSSLWSLYMSINLHQKLLQQNRSYSHKLDHLHV